MMMLQRNWFFSSLEALLQRGHWGDFFLKLLVDIEKKNTTSYCDTQRSANEDMFWEKIMVTDSFLSLSLYVEKLKSLLTALGKHLVLWQGGVLEQDENCLGWLCAGVFSVQYWFWLGILISVTFLYHLMQGFAWVLVWEPFA